MSRSNKTECRSCPIKGSIHSKLDTQNVFGVVESSYMGFSSLLHRFESLLLIGFCNHTSQQPQYRLDHTLIWDPLLRNRIVESMPEPPRQLRAEHKLNRKFQYGVRLPLEPVFQQVTQNTAQPGNKPPITHLVLLGEGPAEQARQRLESIGENQIFSIGRDSAEHQEDLQGWVRGVRYLAPPRAWPPCIGFCRRTASVCRTP